MKTSPDRHVKKHRNFVAHRHQRHNATLTGSTASFWEKHWTCIVFVTFEGGSASGEKRWEHIVFETFEGTRPVKSTGNALFLSLLMGGSASAERHWEYIVSVTVEGGSVSGAKAFGKHCFYNF